MIVKMHEAKSQLSKLVEAANAGEEVIIARGDKPVARIVPITPVTLPPRQPGLLKGKIAFDDSFFDPLPDDELTAWAAED